MTFEMLFFFIWGSYGIRAMVFGKDDYRCKRRNFGIQGHKNVSMYSSQFNDRLKILFKNKNKTMKTFYRINRMEKRRNRHNSTKDFFKIW